MAIDVIDVKAGAPGTGFVEADTTTWTDAAYRRLRAEAETLMNLEESDPRTDRLDPLADLLVTYEAVHFPIGAPSPEAMEAFMREARGEPTAK